jgi:glycosyltransferase involved in cell wall biosynthesis
MPTRAAGASTSSTIEGSSPTPATRSWSSSSRVDRTFRPSRWSSPATGRRNTCPRPLRAWWARLTIVDDGSPDETAAVAADLIARHPSHRIRLIRQANRGLAPARNAGIEASKGRYLLPLDADDMLAPSFLERTVALLEASPSLAIAYTDHERFGESTATVANPEFSAFLVPATNLLNYCSLFRREVWEAVGGYNPNMKLGYEDWDFWVGAVERGYRGARIPEPLLRYRIRSGSMITTAVQHDADLRRQMRANHPRLYRPWLRMARFTVRVARRLRRLAGRLSRRLRSAGSP